MKRFSPGIATVALLAIFVSSFLQPAFAQNPVDRTSGDSTRKWGSESTSVVKIASEKQSPATLSSEPVMRIALATSTGAATISTNAKLVNVPEFTGEPQPLETARVRVEYRTHSAKPSDAGYRTFYFEIACASCREDSC